MLEKVPRKLFLRLFAIIVLVVASSFAVQGWIVILVGQDAIKRMVVESLVTSAQDVLEEVDGYLADRCGEVRSWSGLGTMDEILVHDRFLNIENLLLELQRESRGNYRALTVLDHSGTVVAASDVNRVGQRVPLGALPARQVPGTLARMSDYPAPGDEARAEVLLVHPIISRLNPEPIGWLLAQVSWRPVERIVSGAGSAGGAPDRGKSFLLVDGAGWVLAGNRDLLERLPPGIAAAGRFLVQGAAPEMLTQAGPYLLAGDGSAAMHRGTSADGAVDRELRVVGLWRKEEAFAVERIFVVAVVASAFLGLALAAGASFLITRGISRRLDRLIEGTGRLARGELTFRVDEGKNDEFDGLARSFNVMASELARTGEGLEEAVARWRAIVTHAPDIIMTVAADGTILFINRVVSGFSREAVIGTTLYDYVPPQYHDGLRSTLERVFRTGEAGSLDLEGAGPDGTIAWYSARIGPVEREAQVVAATVITSDITPRKCLEREIIEVSELERNRIGRDLHDGLGQVLTGISLLSKGLEQKLRSREAGEVIEAMQIKVLVADALQQTRALAKGLFPVDLERVGLRGTLEELAASVEQMFGVACRVEGPEVNLHDPSKATHLFRIAQEAISNSLRHGRAKTIVIALSANGDGNLLSIADDGLGLPQVPPEREGMGLRSMRYRAGVLGATLDIRRRPEGGTLVECRFQ